MTGSVLKRPDLQRALSDARMRRFGLLLVYRVDRLSRSVRGLAHLLEDLDHTGVVFRSATEPFDTGTPSGRTMVQMLGVFAEFERATLSTVSWPTWSARPRTAAGTGVRPRSATA